MTLSDCKNCKDSRQGHHIPGIDRNTDLYVLSIIQYVLTDHPIRWNNHIPGDPACVIENMEKIKEEVKKRLRSMGKHGDFEIEEVEQISFQPYSECFSGEG